MSDHPAVSVIIPIYNMEKYIRQCLDSVLGQTLQKIEVLCVNDGSTDRTPKILQDYAEKDQRVRVITQKNSGAGTARNRGLAEAKGETLSFLDADDFFEPDMLETAYLKWQETKSQIIVFDSDQYFEDTGEFKQGNSIRWNVIPPYEPFHRRCFPENPFRVFIGWAWDKLFDARFIQENNLTFQELRTTNDLYFVFSAIALSERIAVSDRKLVHHRRNVFSSLSNTREQSWRCFYEALLKLKQTLTDRGIYNELEQDYVNYCLHACLWNLESLKGESREKLFRMLKEEGFENLGLNGRDMIYFDSRTDYEKLTRIRELSCEEYFQQDKN